MLEGDRRMANNDWNIFQAEGKVLRFEDLDWDGLGASGLLCGAFLDAKSVKSSRNLILIFLVAKVLGTSARKTSWTFSLPIKPSPHFSIAMCYVACHSCFSTFVGTTFIATSPKYVGVVTSYCVVAGSSQLRCQTFSSCCTQRDVR